MHARARNQSINQSHTWGWEDFLDPGHTLATFVWQRLCTTRAQMAHWYACLPTTPLCKSHACPCVFDLCDWGERSGRTTGDPTHPPTRSPIPALIRGCLPAPTSATTRAHGRSPTHPHTPVQIYTQTQPHAHKYTHTHTYTHPRTPTHANAHTIGV